MPRLLLYLHGRYITDKEIDIPDWHGTFPERVESKKAWIAQACADFAAEHMNAIIRCAYDYEIYLHTESAAGGIDVDDIENSIGWEGRNKES